MSSSSRALIEHILKQAKERTSKKISVKVQDLEDILDALNAPPTSEEFFQNLLFTYLQKNLKIEVKVEHNYDDINSVSHTYQLRLWNPITKMSEIISVDYD